MPRNLREGLRPPWICQGVANVPPPPPCIRPWKWEYLSFLANIFVSPKILHFFRKIFCKILHYSVSPEYLKPWSRESLSWELNIIWQGLLMEMVDSTEHSGKLKKNKNFIWNIWIFKKKLFLPFVKSKLLNRDKKESYNFEHSTLDSDVKSIKR